MKNWRLTQNGEVLRTSKPGLPDVVRSATKPSSPSGYDYKEIVPQTRPTPGAGQVLSQLPDAIVGDKVYANRYEAVDAPVPEEVTPRQFQLAVETLHPGLLATIETLVAAQPVTVQINWNKALGVKRNDATLEAMRQHPSIDKTPSEVDAIFRLAATL